MKSFKELISDPDTNNDVIVTLERELNSTSDLVRKQAIKEMLFDAKKAAQQ